MTARSAAPVSPLPVRDARPLVVTSALHRLCIIRASDVHGPNPIRRSA
ncbi:MAG: hypothetical protein JG765_1250 [Cereibacter sp.]|jgi:hypothetical protein|nr:hypothetical protein [Cereibacter sp.]